MNRLIKSFLFVTLLGFISSSNGLNMNGNTNHIINSVKNEVVKIVSRSGSLHINRIYGKVPLMNRPTPYLLANGEMRDWNAARVVGGNSDPHGNVNLQIEIPNVHVIFGKFRGSVIIFPVNLERVTLKLDKIMVGMNLKVQQNGNQCTISANQVNTKFVGVGDLVLPGIPNLPIVREAKSKVLQQMPQKLEEILLQSLQSTRQISCNLF